MLDEEDLSQQARPLHGTLRMLPKPLGQAGTGPRPPLHPRPGPATLQPHLPPRRLPALAPPSSRNLTASTVFLTALYTAFRGISARCGRALSGVRRAYQPRSLSSERPEVQLYACRRSLPTTARLVAPP